MKSIFTYPSNASTQYIDPDYVGTSGTNGFAKRVADVMNGTYKAHVNSVVPGTTEPDYTNVREFVGRHYELFEFWGYTNTTTRYSMYFMPMVQSSIVSHGCTTVDVLGTDSMLFRTTADHGLYTGMQMNVTGFTQTSPTDYTAFNGNDYYVQKINSKIFRLATGSANGTGLDGGGADYAFEKTTYAFGYDMAISEDKNYISIADPIHDNDTDPVITNWVYDAVDDRYEIIDSIRPTGVLDVPAAASYDVYPNWNKLGGSGLKLNDDGTRLFAHAYNDTTDTAYIAYYTRSGTSWTLANTWTLTNNDRRVRFDINDDGTVIAIRTSGESGTNAQLLIETESGGTWTNRVTLDTGVQFWGEVQLDESGDYCVVERAGSEVKFLYTTTGWTSYTEGAWLTIAHGSILSFDNDNDVMALWQSGGTVRLAASPWNASETYAPSFWDYNPGTDTLTLEEEFVGNAANKAIKWNAAGDRVIWGRFDSQIPGAGSINLVDRQTWVYARDGAGDWTVEAIDRNSGDTASNWTLKVRDATTDLTHVNHENLDTVYYKHFAQVKTYSASTFTKTYVAPDMDYVYDTLYGGAVVAETVTLTPATAEPNKWKTSGIAKYSGGNIAYTYYDYYDSQTKPGAKVRKDYFIPAGSTAVSGNTGIFYNPAQQEIPRISVTTDSSGYITGVTHDTEFPGAFSSDHSTIAYLFESQPNLGSAPSASTDLAAAEDVFDTEDEWTVDNYVSGPTASEGKVWPTHVKPRAIRLSVNNPTVTTRSQNGIKYVRDLGFQKLTMEVDYPPMTQEDFDIFMARLQMLRGGRRPFWFDLRGTDAVNNIFEYKGSSSNVYGHYTASTTSTGDSLILIEGFDSNEADVVRYNTTFSNYSLAAGRQGQISFAANDTDANIYGEVKVRLTYPMQSGSSAGERIFFAPVYVICTLVDDNTDFDIGDYRYTGFTIRMELDEFK